MASEGGRMRMKDLVAATGVPRTTIHHYLREGLLPAPTKTASNAAVYGPEHVERLDLIRQLRGGDLGTFALSEVREILALVDQGTEPAAATALAAMAVGAEGDPEEVPATGLSASEFARAAGLSLTFVRRLVDSGLIVGRPGGPSGRPRYYETDLRAAALVTELMEATGLDVDDLAPVSELLGEVVRYEGVLAEVVSAGREGPDARRVRQTLGRILHALHGYLLAHRAEA